MNDVDQTVVMNRPKYYIGSNGSVWGSDTMFLRWELPQLFEVQDGPYRYCSLPLRQFCARVHDCAYYFEDTAMREDVMSCTESPDCKFRAYETSRLSWLKQQLLAAQQKCDEGKVLIEGEDVALGNEVKDTVTTVTDTLDQIGDISSDTKEKIWENCVTVLEKLNATQECIKRLSLPPVKPDVLKATDAGPGVGCSNIEVKFRDAEMARVLNFDRLNRVHRARNDSGQNEAERSNACIGEALVDGASLQWNYYGPLDNLDEDEIKKLSVEDVKQLEEDAMQKNVWRVAKDVTERIQDEPGPAGDFMKAFVTPRENEQFFFNAKQLREFTSAAESKQKDVPGHAYFQKIETFLKQHVQVGELYLEFLKGDCKQTSGKLCDFCTKCPSFREKLQRVPRPKPDVTALPELKYLPHDKTPNTTTDGHQRPVDDFQPRAQIKKHVKEGKLTLTDSESITSFSKAFAVEEDLVRNYLEHLQYLKLKKLKRRDDRKKKKEAESQMTYNDYDWEDMFKKGTLKKKTVPVLDLFLEKHQLGTNRKRKKGEKLQVIFAWLAKAQLEKIGEGEDSNKVEDETDEVEDDTDEVEEEEEEDDGEESEYKNADDNDLASDSEDDNSDVVLQEIGYSSDEDEETEDETEGETEHLRTRAGRHATTYRSRRFFGDSD